VKIGPIGLDVKIIGLTKITKTCIKIKKQQQNISPPRLRFAQSWWADWANELGAIKISQLNSEFPENSQPRLPYNKIPITHNFRSPALSAIFILSLHSVHCLLPVSDCFFIFLYSLYFFIFFFIFYIYILYIFIY